MVWFASRLGVTVSGGPDWLLFPFGAIGMVVVAAVPLYLLVRHRLIAPATLLTAFVLLDARAEFTASVHGPHALYFGGWFFYLGALLLAAESSTDSGRSTAIDDRSRHRDRSILDCPVALFPNILD